MEHKDINFGSDSTFADKQTYMVYKFTMVLGCPQVPRL